MSTIHNRNFLAQQPPKAKTGQMTGETGNQTIVRTLCVHIEGSLTDLAHRGPTAGLWKGVNGRETTLFHPSLEDSGSGEQNDSIVHSLRNGVIKRMTLKEQQSTFPFILGVDINCVPPVEVTNLGEKWAYTVLPNSTINTPQTVYTCDHATQDNSTWQQLYSQWNNANLETHGVMDVPNQPFLFVHVDHPVIGLLRYNQNLIGCDIDAQPKLEREYLKVSKQVMTTCCQTIREDVLSKMKTRDMNLFTLQVRRLNNTPWDEIDHNTLLGLKLDRSKSEDEQHMQQTEHIKEYMTKPYQYMARLEIEYEIPTAAAVAT